MSWKQRVALLVVRAYQLALSPFVGGACRFHPSCSEYAREAIETHGAARGCWLALGRLARCHPFSRAGIDLVPRANECERAARAERGAGVPASECVGGSGGA